MKRLATVVSPIALLAILVIGAAPSTKKANDAQTPSVAQPSVTGTTPVAENALTESALPADQVETPATPANPVAAATLPPNYSIDWYSINGGGTTNASSTNFRMGASIGQSVAGAASSASYQMGIGFWYGAGGGSCACDCHNDPVCDAVISNVQDVVATINVAFRGTPALIDPNANCPYEQTDVNCDTFTSVLDVVKVVNVAFRSANPATEYCVACP